LVRAVVTINILVTHFRILILILVHFHIFHHIPLGVELKWRPYNEDGSVHDCKKKNGNEKEITLEAVLKKLESIGVKVNVEELMKQ